MPRAILNQLRRLRRRWQPVCDACFEPVSCDDGRCPHCGALFTDPRREYHEHMITATWHATSSEDLRQVGGWIHDAYFDWERIVFDAESKVVTIPFEQEPTNEDECGQPGLQLVGRGRFGGRIYKVPFVRCTATIRHATSCVIEERNRDHPGMLNVIEPSFEGEVVLVPVTGPTIRVAVNAIDVQIDMTNELAFYVRRNKTAFGETDRRWDKTSLDGRGV